MIPFGTTKHLILRPVRDTDKNQILSMVDDLRIAHGTKTNYPRPWPDMLWPLWVQALPKIFVALVVEIKPEFLFMRAHDPMEVVEEGETEEEARRRKKFVGFCRLDQEDAKNMDTQLGIMLTVPWQGKGLGTEIMQWLLGYNFETLGMHRMSLLAFGDNERALELYKYLGFFEEGRQREALWHEAKWVDYVLMAMLDREWRAMQSQELDASAFDDTIVRTVCKLP